MIFMQSYINFPTFCLFPPKNLENNIIYCTFVVSNNNIQADQPMSRLHFSPIAGRTEEIITSVLKTPEVEALPELEFTLNLVIEELVCNIVNYAYSDPEKGYIDIEAVDNGETLTLTFRDQGTPFDPLKKEDPDVTLSAEERPIGGLGIFLVKQMMDSVAYEYANGMNILTMSKFHGR